MQRSWMLTAARPYLGGSVGLHTEDADVRFDGVRVRD